ncbi:hypothetical protein HY374_02975 [Candidatus Berkelbacteria bacterium]|nr:hypothetical protein [Candidatus Berkelbacteria bacterium]
MTLAKLAGILGLIFIIGGILVRHRRERDQLYLIGGPLLFIYSLAIGDVIFAILQALFTLAAGYDYWQRRTAKAERS